MRCVLSGALLISLIRDILGTAMPHPMTRVCLALSRLCDPNPVAPAFDVLRLLRHFCILFPLTLILVVLSLFYSLIIMHSIQFSFYLHDF
ncbi:hypothetical protein Syun_001012 [Stephania yunnanensis]|uniref:Secreted peptide n=1 Tax=Stephania yunnanensis TaxID=152371 RepID=A0AAP0LEP9_9MAGN